MATLYEMAPEVKFLYDLLEKEEIDIKTNILLKNALNI